VILHHMATWNFRNLAPGKVELGSGLNVIFGANGQGKTNLLEAIAVLGSLRSFRSHRYRPLLRHGERCLRLEGMLGSDSGPVALEVSWEVGPPPRRQLRLNGDSVHVSRYLQVFPVVVLAPGDRELVVGKPQGRRAYLDRLAFLLSRRHLDHLQRYRKLLDQRNAGLVRGVGGHEMAAWESQLAESAARIVLARRRVLERLEPRFQRIYHAIGGEGFPELRLEYQAEASLPPGDVEEALAEIYRKRYNDQRDRDRETGYTTAGPHRHDLMIRGTTGHVRDYLSAGQVKAVAAGLRLSFLEEVEEDRGEVLPLGIDDVDAEIDRAVTQRVLSLAAKGRQLVVTSTRAELGAWKDGSFRRHMVRDGSIQHVVGREESV